MKELTLESIQGIPKNGPTDPIEYYSRPGVGRLFRERINRGLRLIPERKYRCGLEIGYGSGGLLTVLAAGVETLHGIDLDADPKLVSTILAGRGCHANLVQGSVYKLPYADATFDLIVCFSVFEHLHEYRAALREVQRVLTPDGFFLLGMPAVNPLMTKFFQAIGHNTIDDIHVTSPRMITGSFAASGLKLASASFLDFPARRPFGLRLYNNWLLQKGAPGDA